MADELEERDAMDWLEDEEMMRQWAEVSKEEEKKMLRRNEGRKYKAEGVQYVPEVMVLHAQIMKEAKKEKEKKKVVVRSTEKMKEDRSKRDSKDTDETVKWRSIKQEEVENIVERTVPENGGGSSREVQSRGGQEGCIQRTW